MEIRNARTPISLVALMTLSLLVGCTTSSHIMIGSSRLPVDPASVRLYVDPPPVFETIAIIDVETEAGWDKQGATDIVVNRLKDEAAALGANGIILRYSTTEDRAARQTIVPVIHAGEGLSIITGDDGPNARVAGQAIYVAPDVESDAAMAQR